jgi:hypothetical protein
MGRWAAAPGSPGYFGAWAREPAWSRSSPHGPEPVDQCHRRRRGLPEAGRSAQFPDQGRRRRSHPAGCARGGPGGPGIGAHRSQEACRDRSAHRRHPGCGGSRRNDLADPGSFGRGCRYRRVRDRRRKHRDFWQRRRRKHRDQWRQRRRPWREQLAGERHRRHDAAGAQRAGAIDLGPVRLGAAGARVPPSTARARGSNGNQRPLHGARRRPAKARRVTPRDAAAPRVRPAHRGFRPARCHLGP